MKDPLVNYLAEGGLPLTWPTKHGDRYLNQHAPQQANNQQISGGGAGGSGQGSIGGTSGSGVSQTGLQSGLQAGQGADAQFAGSVPQIGGVGQSAYTSGTGTTGGFSGVGGGVGFRDLTTGYGPSRVAQEDAFPTGPVTPTQTYANVVSDGGDNDGGGDGAGWEFNSTGALNPWGNNDGWGNSLLGIEGDPSGNTAGSFGYMTGGALGFLPGGSILQGINNASAIGRAQDFAGVENQGFFSNLSTNPFDSIGTTTTSAGGYNPNATYGGHTGWGVTDSAGTNVNFGGGISGPGVTYDGGLIGGISRAFGGTGAAGALTSGVRNASPDLITPENYTQFSTAYTPAEANRRAAAQEAARGGQTIDQANYAAQQHIAAQPDDWASDGDGGGSDYGSSDERDAVANDDWGSDAHFDAIDDQFDSNDGGDDGGGK